jgi:hypothetical protein
MQAQPLLVHFVFHPESANGRAIALRLHRELNEEEVVPGLRIPTVFSSVPAGGGPPPNPRFNLANRNFFVVLADDHVVIDEKWSRHLADIWCACQEPDSRCLPFQLSKNAWPLDDRLREISFPPAHTQPPEDQLAFVTRRLLIELCRFLYRFPVQPCQPKAPVVLFLSHAKTDIKREPRVMQALIDALKQDQPVDAWVDSGDIAGGSRFADAIDRGVKNTSLLAVLTDHYASREWCREEILLAKEHQRPIAVVDALTTYEVRSFPFLGNVPRVRWDGNPEPVINLILKETVRGLHSVETLARVGQPDDVLISRPPEFATLVGMEPGTSVVYPDPPLGSGEMRRLTKTKVRLTTPLQRLAEQRPLQRKRIALSMSESTDAGRFGTDLVHLEAAVLEVARYLLIKGATLAYGGHMGSEGFTLKLAELVRTHNTGDYGMAVERIVNFRGWPLPKLSVEKEAEMRSMAQIMKLPRPTDIGENLDPTFVLEPEHNIDPAASAVNRFAWARGMTEMRSYQADSGKSGVIARIVAGGTFGPTLKVTDDGTKSERWYSGRIPGVLEEVALAAQAGQPVFLLGAFGGAARLAIDLLRGVDREEASWEYQKRAPFAPQMRELYQARGVEWLDYPEIIALLRGKGIAGINPLLTADEHEQLFESVDPLAIAELLLHGLNKLSAKQ